jgi:DNA-directed RNA polymerase alpha subunit
VHPKVVSERLGHATVAITLDTYSHAIPAMQEEAAALIAGLVFVRLRPPVLVSEKHERLLREQVRGQVVGARLRAGASSGA